MNTSISELINKIETNSVFQTIMLNSLFAQKIWVFIKVNPKLLAATLIAGSLFFIFKFGQDVGEFLFYVTH